MNRRITTAALAVITTLTLTACGGSDDATTDAERTTIKTKRDVSAENFKYKNTLRPMLQDNGTALTLRDAYDICDQAIDGRSEDQIVEDADPYDEDGYRQVIRATAHYMCDWPANIDFQPYSPAE